MAFAIPKDSPVNTIVFTLEPAVILRRSTSDRQTILVLGIPALLIFAILAFGSFDPWAFAVLEIGSALLFLSWVWPRISSGSFRLKPSSLYAPTALFGLVIVAQILLRTSAYVHATEEELLKYAAYAVLLFLATQCQRGTLMRVLTILGLFGLIIAIFALFQDLTFNGRIYWLAQSSATSFGPYANYNHYAGLMEMLTPIPLTLALLDDSKRRFKILWLVASIVMAATIFISGSRGGMIAFFTETLFLAGYIAAQRSRQTAWALLAICVLTASLAAWIDDGRMLGKLDSLREPLTNSATRLTIVKDSIKMIRDRPIVGWGLGVFPVVYPQYRTFATDLFVNQAHNDYIQVLVETGILGFACVVWFIVNLYRSALHSLRTYSKAMPAVTLGPLIGCTGILVHSTSDFNLHIPANAALFFVLCGIASGPMRQSAANWWRNRVAGPEIAKSTAIDILSCAANA